jgi:hypothetical protein
MGKTLKVNRLDAEYNRLKLIKEEERALTNVIYPSELKKEKKNSEGNIETKVENELYNSNINKIVDNVKQISDKKYIEEGRLEKKLKKEKNKKETKEKKIKIKIDFFPKYNPQQDKDIHFCIKNGIITCLGYNKEEPSKPYCTVKCDCTYKKIKDEKPYCGYYVELNKKE